MSLKAKRGIDIVHKLAFSNVNKLTKVLYTQILMDRGNRIALAATIIFATSCAKPDLNSITTDITKSIDDMSSTITNSIKGGYSTDEAKRCLGVNINIAELELPTKTIVSIKVNPDFFSLHTKSKATLDFNGQTYYYVDLIKRQLILHEVKKNVWIANETINLPPSNHEQYLYTADNTRKKDRLKIKNPFLIPRDRLSIRQGINGINVFGGTNTFDNLTEGEIRGIDCAAALNSYFEKFMKTQYEFSN